MNGAKNGTLATSDLRLVLGGIKSFVPSLSRSTGTGGTVDPRYCYAVWLRHLHMITAAGIDPVRETVVELGPGDSIGTGFAALLTTSERYIALDVVPHAAAVVQATLLDAVADMLRRQVSIPDATAFPNLFPRLADYRFPAQILPASRLAETLRPERVDELRAAIDGMSKNDGTSRIGYACPWTAESVRRGSADLVFSQAALQEIDNPGANGALRRTFAAMAQWLKPGGIISHQVDLGMYGAEPWDRHWTYSDATWALIRGRRPNYINRQPLSAYEGLCREFGFDIARLDVVEQDIATPTSELAVGFRTLSQRDRTARAVHIVAVKR